MDICASNGVDNDHILDSIESAKLDQGIDTVTTNEGKRVNEVVIQTEGKVVQEFVVPNTPLVKPLAAAPRMPQQSAPRNTTQEESAGVPSSVPTPTFAIPPHLMGRNVNNPTEDMIGSGRKLQKPRLGVRVPYRNLTSQIVTQDEIAQELLERSLKKHPVHDTPEGGDLFFTMKLTQRLANRLSPSAAVGSAISGHDIEAVAGKSGQFQQGADTNCILPPGYSLVPESTAIPDHGDLLAILEGDADTDWMPDTNPSALEDVVKPVSVVDSSRPPTFIEAGSSLDQISVHTIPTKLDPLVEREMALKQLMELPIRTKKKKTVETSTKGSKSQQKTRERGKKDSKDQKDETKSAMAQKSQDSQNNNRASVNGNSKVEIDLTLKQKPGRKRKLANMGDGGTKQPKMSKKKKVDSSVSQLVVITGNNKTDKKPKLVRAAVTKKPMVVKSPVLNNGVIENSTVCVAPKRRKLTALNSSESNSVLGVDASGKSVPGTSQESASTSMSDGNSDDEFPESMLMHSRKFASPPRTYSPRKRVVKPGGDLPSSAKKSAVAAMLVKEIGFTLSQCMPNSSTKSDESTKFNTSGSLSSKSNSVPSRSSANLPSKVTGDSSLEVPGGLTTKNIDSSSRSVANLMSESEKASCLNPAGGTVVTPQSAKRNINVSSNGQSSGDSRRRRMTEIDRLFMDEGAINLLYEVEQGESKRRSGPPETISNSPKRKVRSALKSVRRQKKDLQLKTRLVKNAVFRLSSIAQSPSTAVALRARRHVGPPTLQLATSQNPDRSFQRKKSLDSRDSLRSPPPLTPVDPPSPSQSFSFPPRLHLPAEASRIIRRHSSSSTFSSRSTSPNLQHRNSIDSVHSPENFENKPDNHHMKSGNCIPAPSGTKNSSELDDVKRNEVRKKGVPIFVRKLEATQTYKGKKKKEPTGSDSGTLQLVENAGKLLEMKCKEIKVHQRAQTDVSKKPPCVEVKKKVVVSAAQMGAHKKMSSAVKMKIKSQMTKNFQKGKSVQLKKPVSENPVGKLKKREDTKERVDIVDLEMPDLTSCLAAVATEFEAEVESIKKATHFRRTSHDSSPGPSQGSSNNQQPPLLKKETKDVPPPLSPNASSYSTLIKTLETESQKPKKKEEEGQKQRSSVRQNAGTYHYKEICLRRYDNLVQIILTPASTKMKNSLNLQVLRELREVLSQLKRDEGCRVVLLTSAGSSFCQGIDFHSLLHTNADKRKTAAQDMAQALKEFLKSLALFSKPLVAGVHGAAVGLGVTMLPFFDMVFASDKATFYTPYAKLGQVPEGAAILTLPHMLGNAVTSELLFGCRKLTATEALHFGLVTRILWPDKFQEELIPIIRSMANQSAQSMEATKALLRHTLRAKLEAALDSEVPLLVQHWISTECQTNFRRFLDDEDVGLQRQRLDP